jgi:Low-density lipoprotein receptor domain class A
VIVSRVNVQVCGSARSRRTTGLCRGARPLALMVCLLGAACSDAPEGPPTEESAPEACERLQRARVDCGLESATCASEAEQCVARCLVSSDCDTLKGLAVDFSTVLCTFACSSFRCGSGDEIPAGWQCDGEIDCQDASDERECSK